MFKEAALRFKMPKLKPRPRYLNGTPMKPNFLEKAVDELGRDPGPVGLKNLLRGAVLGGVSNVFYNELGTRAAGRQEAQRDSAKELYERAVERTNRERSRRVRDKYVIKKSAVRLKGLARGIYSKYKSAVRYDPAAVALGLTGTGLVAGAASVMVPVRAARRSASSRGYNAMNEAERYIRMAEYERNRYLRLRGKLDDEQAINTLPVKNIGGVIKKNSDQSLHALTKTSALRFKMPKFTPNTAAALGAGAGTGLGAAIGYGFTNNANEERDAASRKVTDGLKKDLMMSNIVSLDLRNSNERRRLRESTLKRQIGRLEQSLSEAHGDIPTRLMPGEPTTPVSGNWRHSPLGVLGRFAGGLALGGTAAAGGVGLYNLFKDDEPEDKNKNKKTAKDSQMNESLYILTKTAALRFKMPDIGGALRTVGRGLNRPIEFPEMGETVFKGLSAAGAAGIGGALASSAAANELLDYNTEPAYQDFRDRKWDIESFDYYNDIDKQYKEFLKNKGGHDKTSAMRVRGLNPPLRPLVVSPLLSRLGVGAAGATGLGLGAWAGLGRVPLNPGPEQRSYISENQGRVKDMYRKAREMYGEDFDPAAILQEGRESSGTPVPDPRPNYPARWDITAFEDSDAYKKPQGPFTRNYLKNNVYKQYIQRYLRNNLHKTNSEDPRMSEHFYASAKTAALRFKMPDIKPSFKLDTLTSPGIRPARRIQPQMRPESPGADVGITLPRGNAQRGPITFAQDPATRMSQLGSIGKGIAGSRAARIGAVGAPAAFGMNELLAYLRSQQVGG